jgi:isoquinoline 1-oxidoreductase alpha subunit
MDLNINQQVYQVVDEPDRPLLWVLRDDLGLTGTKFGCGAGFCGSCTVLVDGEAVRSCVTLISALQGKQILTIEGLAVPSLQGEAELHPVQQAFLDEQAPQCGWCMPGQMLTAVALLEANPDPTDDEIRLGMNGVYCRCGAYHRIRRAVRRATEIGASRGEQA